jgi:hypothetical protein
VIACAVVAVTPATTQTQVPSGRAAALRVFSERVDRYVWLRAKCEDPLPSFDLRRDPWSLLLTRRYLASAIRTARTQARAGDIFSPPVADLFRVTIREAIYERDIEGVVKDETVVDLIVNEPIPDWALSPVPGALLEMLPPLPDAIEYRMVGGALILWDMHAQILIDGLPYAFLIE